MMPDDGTGTNSPERFAANAGRAPLQPGHVNIPPRRPSSASALPRKLFSELSQIRETSESSAHCVSQGQDPVTNTNAHRRTGASIQSHDGNVSGPQPYESSPGSGPKCIKVARRAASSVSLPWDSIPKRKSSASIFRDGPGLSRQSSIQDFPSWKLPSPSAAGEIIPNRGKADSSLREVIDHDAISSDNIRYSPSRTFVRTIAPIDILDCPSARHQRVTMNTHLASPLFVGGGTVEGHVQITVSDDTKTKTNPAIFIKRLSVDIIGLEEVADGRRWVFLSLTSELFDDTHPPPPSLVSSQHSVSPKENKWVLKLASAVIPFCMNLPLNLGPPSYSSKQARIQYLLCPTIVVQEDKQTSIIRQSWIVQMLTVHDPEKALSSLPSPLLSSDSLTFSSRSAVHRIKLTAGLHRQTWVSGARIFVDIHIMNHAPKRIKRIELQLEKMVLWYAHAAAGTVEKIGSYPRVPRRTDVEIVAKSILKRSKQWQGVGGHTTEVRTMDVEVPREHVTISIGRYFGVRYFLNVIISSGRSKTLAVQLPVTIIHINSLDIVPNSLAQVAAAIEAKRARTVPVIEGTGVYPQYHQGQAFSAPRRKSLERVRSQATLASGFSPEELGSLTREIESSPRRRVSDSGGLHKPRFGQIRAADIDETTSQQRQEQIDGASHNVNCQSCESSPNFRRGHHRRKSSRVSDQVSGPKIPRLQLSTSGLGFSGSEFSISSDSPPRKVMLSEHERQLIHQQRELRLARQRSIAHNQYQDQHQHQPSWSPQIIPRIPIQTGYQQNMMRRNHSVMSNSRGNHSRGSFGRSRSRTIPSPERDREPRDERPFTMYDHPTNIQRGPSYRHWGWNNVAANAGHGNLRQRYSVDGLRMHPHPDSGRFRASDPSPGPGRFTATSSRNMARDGETGNRTSNDSAAWSIGMIPWGRGMPGSSDVPMRLRRPSLDEKRAAVAPGVTAGVKFQA